MEDGSNKNINKGRLMLYVLLGAIILLLSAIFLKDYYEEYQVKKKAEAKKEEILSRGSSLWLWEVAPKCYKDIIYDSKDTSIGCSSAMESFNGQIVSWRNLVNEKTNINCSDFRSKKDAQGFFEYFSGELAKGYYAYKQIEDDGKEDTTFVTTSGPGGFDGKCYYDPYGLDTNHDCNACENL